jgi:hypothetical protein
MAHAVKTGRIKAFRPAGSFEAFTQGCDTWARFVGTDEVEPWAGPGQWRL